MRPAPVAVFTYNRPQHARATLEALFANEGVDDASIFIYSDAPKRPEHEPLVEEVRRLLRGLARRNVTVVERMRNLGIAGSIRSSTTELLDEFGRVVVLEDDLLTSRWFLRYMNEALERYCDDDRVWQVCGFTYGTELPARHDAFFCRMSSSWGWGTWKRAWDRAFDDRARQRSMLRESAHLRWLLDLEGRFPIHHLMRQSERGRTDSWEVWFQVGMFLAEGLALWPRRSMIRNFGQRDGSGVHGRWVRRSLADSVHDVSDQVVRDFPETVEIDAGAWQRALEVLREHSPWWYPALSAWSRAFT